MAKREIVAEGKNFKRYSDGTILVMGVRASYPHCFVPQASDENPDGPKSYSITGLLPKKTHEAAKNEVKKMISELLETNKAKFKGAKPVLPADRKFLRDGDLTGKVENEGMFTISARENKRPSVRDRDKSVLSKDDADRIYGGCWVNILIRPWFQDNKYGKRVNANFVALQFVKDDTAFGEGRLSDEDIDDTFDDEDGDESDSDSGFDDDDDGEL